MTRPTAALSSVSDVYGTVRSPPPMRVFHDGWLRKRDLTLREAEAHHLREAAKLVGRSDQEHHLYEAALNRFWARRVRMNSDMGPLEARVAGDGAKDAIGDALHAIKQGHRDIALQCLERAALALK